MNEWITLKAVINDSQATFYVSNAKEPILIVNDMIHGASQSGSIGLFVDIGTEGFFKDLKILSTD